MKDKDRNCKWKMKQNCINWPTSLIKDLGLVLQDDIIKYNYCFLLSYQTHLTEQSKTASHLKEQANYTILYQLDAMIFYQIVNLKEVDN